MQFGQIADGMVEALSSALAEMSREFDPFGYKTAFRTIGEQNRIIQQQAEVIQRLQQREIEPLQRENRQLRKKAKKDRQKKGKKKRAKKR